MTRGALARVLLPVALALAARAALAVDPWWDGAWHERYKLQFDNSGQTNDALVNFPVLVTLTAENFNFDGAGSNGEGLRFVDADGPAELPYEIESWNRRARFAEVWVAVPHIPAGSDTNYIWLYSGNRSAPDNQQPSNVWDSVYWGVWHLSDAAEHAGEVSDSTANRRHGTWRDGDGSGNTRAQGVIGGGVGFGGTDFVAVPWDVAFSGTITVSAWVYTEGEEGVVFDRPGINYCGTWNQCLIKQRLAHVKCTTYACSYNLADALAATSAIEDEVWYHVVWQWGAAGRRIYLNGELNVSDDTRSIGSNDPASALPWIYIGAPCTGHATPTVTFAVPFEGVLDEVRLSRTSGVTPPHSADYVRAAYLTMTHQSFPSYGPAEQLPRTGSALFGW